MLGSSLYFKGFDSSFGSAHSTYSYFVMRHIGHHTPDMVSLFTSIDITCGPSGPRFMKSHGIAQTGEAAALTIHPEVRDMYCSPSASPHAHSTAVRRETAHILGAGNQTKATRRIVPNSILLVVPMSILRSRYSLTVLTATKFDPCTGRREEYDRPGFTSPWPSSREYD
jgi:hypothetical protein